MFDTVLRLPYAVGWSIFLIILVMVVLFYDPKESRGDIGQSIEEVCLGGVSYYLTRNGLGISVTPKYGLDKTVVSCESN